MRSRYHSWIAAIRIARREAWRSKGRSALVLSMIALPILGVSATDLTLRSAEPSAEQKLTRALGAADARVQDAATGGAPIYQTPSNIDYQQADPPKDGSGPSGPGDLLGAVPEGATVLRESRGEDRIRTRHGLLRTALRELDAGHPIARGLITLDRGRLPSKTGELAASTRFLTESGLFLGSTVRARDLDAPYRIVGVYENPGDLRATELLATPGDLLAPLAEAQKAAGQHSSTIETTLLVRVAGEDGFTWNMVRQANAKGVRVTSRAVALAPPADAEVPLHQIRHGNSAGDGETDRSAMYTVAATAAGLAMLEICLLAGPAFAVGARRSRRQLGLVGANGGDRHHIRAIVLAGGLVIGVAAAVIGTVLGVLLTLALQPLLEQQVGRRFASFDVRPLELLSIALLAVLTGLLAAAVPAFTASRQTVLTSLTGRNRGIRHANRALPAIGLIALGAGAAVALHGAVGENSYMIVAAGSALAELGIVALTPTLVGLFGRAGRWLPLSPRLALRDAVRNRGRTAPAVAAVLAAVAGTVAVATYDASRESQNRAEYHAQLPAGSGSLSNPDADGFRDVPEGRRVLTDNLPLAVRADVARIAVGNPGCEPWSETAGCGSVGRVKPPEQDCPLWTESSEDLSPTARRRLSADWRCQERGFRMQWDILVADEKLLSVLDIEDPAATEALRTGRAVSFDRVYVKDGKTELNLSVRASSGELGAPTLKTLPTYQVEDFVDSYGLGLIIPPSAARAAGLSTVPVGTYFTTDGKPSSAQLQHLDAALGELATSTDIYLEEGYRSRSTLALLALTLFAGIVTVGAAGLATGLAQADAETDLKTLAAIGAPPRVRRVLSGFQCAVVAAMGVVLGSVAGILPAVALRWTERREQAESHRQAVIDGWDSVLGEPFVPVVVPWAVLAALLVVVPLSAALLAALVTRSSPALTRRDAG
ncbi:FtsX-like permease family protein [Streptomyces sp. NPDC006879]|uniref:FtsX-like permease family protein n=1 Tax=Streptomyces sp. NPDC006879 TaxID=3364767 RepID=UPI00369996E9